MGESPMGTTVETVKAADDPNQTLIYSTDNEAAWVQGVAVTVDNWR